MDQRKYVPWSAKDALGIRNSIVESFKNTVNFSSNFTTEKQQTNDQRTRKK